MVDAEVGGEGGGSSKPDTRLNIDCQVELTGKTHDKNMGWRGGGGCEGGGCGWLVHAGKGV